ncbi:MAG: hypothetical protein CM15mP51_22300 [Porticoccaceae bacterium]|nr:MAG: hypothetical protein CM15mP51_22300 [Porticoccaceae bacterium]
MDVNKNAIIYIENIKRAFIKYDNKNAKTYIENAARYSSQILALDKPLREKSNCFHLNIDGW